MLIRQLYNNNCPLPRLNSITQPKEELSKSSMESSVDRRPEILLLPTISTAGRLEDNTDLRVKIQTILVPKGK